MTSIFPKTEPLLASSRITLKGIEVIEIFDSDEEAPPSSSRISTRSDRKGVATRSTQTHPFPSNAFSSTLTSPYTHKHGYAHRASTSRKSDPTNTASRRKRLQEAEEAKSHHKRTKSLVARQQTSTSVSAPQSQRKRIPLDPPPALLMPPTSGYILPRAEGIQIRDRPPSPPPTSSLSIQNPKLAPGMRKYEVHCVYSPSHHLNITSQLSFAISEIPSFDRKTWTRLNTHRYKFSSLCYYPTTELAQKQCAEALQGQLLSLMRLKEWPVGEEPEITFPKVDGVLHEFVDILFKTKKQHEVGREPRPPLRAVCDPLIPWLHAAFVDEKEYFVVQGTNPHLTPNEKTGEYSDKQIGEMKMWGVNFMCSFVRSENFCTTGKPICVWYLPYGFPHSPDFVPSTGAYKKRPEYIVLLRRHADSAKLKINTTALAPYVEVIEPGEPRQPQSIPDDEEGWAYNRYEEEADELEMTWVKVFWEGRPELCDYCKSALDGHLNVECRRRRRPARTTWRS